jgi:soluble lytic murein transglycosylase-like protein
MRVRSTILGVLAVVAGSSIDARADVFAFEKDGVMHITSERPRRERVLLHLKDDTRRKGRAATSPGPVASLGERRSPRRSGSLPTPAELAPIVKQAAEYYSLPEALVWAVMKIESGFNPTVVSHAGAQGLMQLMPGTAGDMGVTDPFDPTQSIFGGARYLRMLANRFDGDLVLTLSGYHAGGGAVDSVGGIPYTQTAEYVRMVLNAYYAYQRQLPAQSPP